MTTTTNTTDTPLAGTGPTGHSPSGGQDSTTEQVKNTASVAQDEAKHVASDVRDQARGLLNETRVQVEDQSRTQRDRLVDTIRTFSNDLDGMAEQRSGLASDAAREVANRVRSFGQQLDGREPTELLDELRSFARRRPGMFLAGSVVAGVVVGRFLRGARDAAQTDSRTGTQPVSTGTAYPSVSQYGGPTEVAVTPERPLGTSYDTTVTAEAPIDPLTSPPASPAVTSGESERPVGGL
jgi:hypothetical protein